MFTWRSYFPCFMPRVFFAPDGGEGGGAPAPAEDGTANPEGQPDEGGSEGGDLNAEIARLKSEMAKQKAAMDKALSETNSYKKQLRARQTAEEAAAEEAKAAEEARNNELTELRKKFAVMETTKNIAVKLGGNEESSGKIAEYLYGAEDADAVIAEFQKILAEREKKLRQEFGRVPPPGAGSANGGESEAVRRARELGRAKAEANQTAQNALKAYMR